MFRIEAFCDDRRLGDVLRAMAGLIIDSPRVTPVVNAQLRNGKLAAQSEGSLPVMFAKFIRENKVKEVNARVAREWLVSMGRSKLSSNYLLKNCVQSGILKSVGKGTKMKYTVQS